MTFGPGKFQTRKIPAIAALGLAGFLGVASCTTSVVAIHQPQPPTQPLSPLAPPTGNDAVARNIGRIVVGNGGLGGLDNGDGRATLATCDPSTVSNQTRVGTRMSVSCGISYSDGSVWRQTVTVTFDIHGHPVADWTDLGTELLQPTGG
jgi:hypothetical protein